MKTETEPTETQTPLAERPEDTLVFRTFRPGDEEPFKRLNEAWIRELFTLEAADSRVLDHPREVILEPGGEICVAELAGEVVGCCALVAIREGEFELAKMTVSEAARGRGVGRRLLEYTIAEGRRRGARRLYLNSNSRLQNAIHLYEQLGFRHIPPVPVPYSRVDVHMEMVF
ncbi:GNAT family N-acetyltransferase [Silvibacterium sp.]|uniref:GNAT family N-acetyltransferase n=1 Tax=Silvibacterium sp. TaxID=1964179 RepID=UPI0039E59597